MVNNASGLVPHIAVSSSELSAMRTRISRCIARLSVFVFSVSILGPILLEWLAPAGLTAWGFLLVLVETTFETVSSVEFALSQYFEQTAVFGVACLIYFVVLVLNQILACAELMVNTELSSSEKFEKARKGHDFLRKSSALFLWVYGVSFVVVSMSMLYKVLVLPDFEISFVATFFFLLAPVFWVLVLFAPVSSYLIPSALRRFVDSGRYSSEVREAIHALHGRCWSDNTVSYADYPGIYFYWLSKQENMLDAWKLGCGIKTDKVKE